MSEAGFDGLYDPNNRATYYQKIIREFTSRANSTAAYAASVLLEREKEVREQLRIISEDTTSLDYAIGRLGYLRGHIGSVSMEQHVIAPGRANARLINVNLRTVNYRIIESSDELPDLPIKYFPTKARILKPIIISSYPISANGGIGLNDIKGGLIKQKCW